MCTLLKMANRRPVDLISPFLFHKEQTISVGSTDDNSRALAHFSCTVHVFSVSSTLFMRFPRFGTFAVRAAPRTRTTRVADYLPTSSKSSPKEQEWLQVFIEARERPFAILWEESRTILKYSGFRS